MTFNCDKFECLRYWPKQSKPDLEYKSPDGTVIEEKEHLRDLGVEMSSDLTFLIHINNTVAAANKKVPDHIYLESCPRVSTGVQGNFYHQ